MQFPTIPIIPYEGADSKNPLAFKYYNPDEHIGTSTMKEHLRFSIAFWHTCTGTGTDPFGLPTMQRPWDIIDDPMKKAEARVLAMFEIAEKLQVPFFCFHDRDIAPEAETLRETNAQLDTITALLKTRMADSPLSLLWGTANLFSHPRYMHGAATSPQPQVFAYAAAQVKKALEITKELGGANYVFWGGREGYETLLNTHMKLEMDNLARFLHMAIAYAKEIGFEGQLLFEPKPKEPTKHQYDFDVGTIIGFLHTYNLFDKVKINIEANHATLAGHTMQHELYLARINGILGSVDANQGDMLLGWDTDQFPTDIYGAMFVMYEILKNNGIAPGGINFDAKLRRGSCLPEDIFYGHIAGIDTFARGLRIAYALLASKELEQYVEQRYAAYNAGIGKEITDDTTSFSKLEQYALAHETIETTSGQQELLESIVNRYIR